MWWLFRAIFSSIFLLSIVLSIPVAFDVGGRDSGLAYSLALFLFYFIYSSLELLTPEKSRSRSFLAGFLRLSQWIIIPALLIWALGQFAVDAGNTNWVERTVGGLLNSKSTSWREWLFGRDGLVETVTLGGWDNVLRYSGPVFQLLEGFCTLLVIQAAGQLTRWLVNRGRSDTWLIVLLVLSSSIMASAVYFLWRVAQFPQIGNVDATLIGIAMTTAVFLCAFGIGSGRGNPIESSLLFAYIVLCIYQIFTDYLPSGNADQAHDQDSSESDIPPLPPIIMASYSTFLHMLSSLPYAVHSSLALLYAAFQTITPSVIISLTYRSLVFYCATRIIPSIRESGAQAMMQEPEWEDGETASKFLGFLSWFSPSILIAVYTSLLLQHFSTSDGPDGWTLRGGDVEGSNWQWANIGLTMVLYGVELYLSSDEHDHWKVD
ncbi:related to ICE2 - protein with role in forming and/or maintaining the cortical ER network [Fusarium torulosum]|uniref:Related to ICE2 - protein with role in forming and/or maintaining the cortical ER network n=1 Tax=Fusarium torulosum TaxID=33205 RepID=A0AAE8LZF3_9HYPO|nr:related to ICE2 - protein with role in forming and/or maintaining the cortical ER network [Fusarium torulosum]